MHSARIKNGVFVLEGINSLASTFYFYYIYFFTAEVFGFTKLQNLLLAAAVGFVYMLGSVSAGRIAQRHGYFFALRCGSGILLVALLAGSQVHSLGAHLIVLGVATAGQTLTWPSLEALISEGEEPIRLPRVVGRYNLVWAVTGALAYLVSDRVVTFAGWRAIFLMPAFLQMVLLVLAFILERAAGRRGITATAPTARQSPPLHASGDQDLQGADLAGPVNSGGPKTHPPPDSSRGIVEGDGDLPHPPRLRSPVTPRTFLSMAWLANPFAYLAINTVVAVSPNLDQSLQLSAHGERACLSAWMFARAAAFLLFWLWTGWHYRFRWLANAYAAMLVSLVILLLAPTLSVLLAAEFVFGVSVGLIYDSSLFYSMDVGHTKGEHGGVHEAMIGAGSCVGPALGAAALHFFPTWPQSSAWGVGALLLLGLGGLLHLRWRRPPTTP